jgi:thiol-disulfide isomerase/thioredoxin
MIASSFLFALALSFAPPQGGAAPAEKPVPKLAPGMPAPALAIEKWVKGSPVASFEKGKIYVVEFWATWCGPCIASMPHISALQKRYADKGLTVIGVSSVDSRGNSLEKVEKMVADKGDGMGYTVAWDKERTTNEAFMAAAGQSGIPCSFLIDKEGRVAYIGHPMTLDQPLAHVVAGTWDIEKGNAAMSEARSISTRLRTDAKGALAAIDEFEKRYPAFAVFVADAKFSALLATGEHARAIEVGRGLVDAAIEAHDSQKLNGIAWSIVDPEAKLETRDLDLALKAAEKAVEFSEWRRPEVLDTLAWVWFWKGDSSKAIEIEGKAIALATGPLKAQLEDTLAKFRAKTAQ